MGPTALSQSGQGAHAKALFLAWGGWDRPQRKGHCTCPAPSKRPVGGMSLWAVAGLLCAGEVPGRPLWAQQHVSVRTAPLSAPWLLPPVEGSWKGDMAPALKAFIWETVCSGPSLRTPAPSCLSLR